ncbi:MAG: hypothetical protein RL264_2385 [Bacteroidota bacterium]|jgi:RHS repeat-associated protein
MKNSIDNRNLNSIKVFPSEEKIKTVQGNSRLHRNLCGVTWRWSDLNNIYINNIFVGSGSIFVSSSTTLQTTGTVNVANAIAGISGTVTVRLDLYNRVGPLTQGTFRMDDFVLNGYTTAVEHWSPAGYRYGFQNQEEDSETGLVNYKYRMHDPRVGRFFAVDPLGFKYPWNSCYAFSENRVLDAIELEGLEAVLIDDIIPTENGYIIKLVPDEEIINNGSCPFQLRLAPGLDSRYPDGKVIYGDRDSEFNFLYEGLNKKINAKSFEGYFCITKDKCWIKEDVNGYNEQDGLVPKSFAFQIADLTESKTNSMGPLVRIPIIPIIEADIDIVKLVKKEYSFISPASADGLVRYTLRLHQFDAPNTFEIQSDYFENGKMTFTGNETITFEVPANSEFTISISGESHHDKFEITGEAEIIKKN